MRYLGLDLGNRTCGVAVSDGMGLIATGVTTFHFKEKDLQSVLEYVKMEVRNRNIDCVVLGLPKNMDGSLGFQAEYVMEFKKMLEAERLTTIQVTRVMIDADMSRQKRKQQVDKLAAVVILQSYLDRINK